MIVDGCQRYQIFIEINIKFACDPGGVVPAVASVIISINIQTLLLPAGRPLDLKLNFILTCFKWIIPKIYFKSL
jgi:hypothetical protein